MSFSRSLGGTAAVALATLAAFPAEQKAIDQAYDAQGNVVDGHQRQIAAMTDAVKPVLEAMPAEASLSGSLLGHANNDGSGTYGWSLQVSGSGSTEAIADSAAADTAGSATAG